MVDDVGIVKLSDFGFIKSIYEEFTGINTKKDEAISPTKGFSYVLEEEEAKHPHGRKNKHSKHNAINFFGTDSHENLLSKKSIDSERTVLRPLTKSLYCSPPEVHMNS